MKKLITICAAAAMMLATSSTTLADIDQDFSANVDGWFTEGNNVTWNGAAAGTATITQGAYTRFGGYSSVFPAGGFTTSLDIYLDVDGGFANDNRFDFTVAINNSAGDHRRDFAFNGGFYDDSDVTGSGDRFVFSASNTTGRGNSYPKNPGRDPFSLDTTGWYSFQHAFYDDGAGILAVDLSIIDAADNTLHTWTLSDPLDAISGIGGNRYGWFPNIELPSLTIDNSTLTSVQAAPVPVPGAFVLGAMGLGMVGWMKRRKQKA